MTVVATATMMVMVMVMVMVSVTKKFAVSLKVSQQNRPAVRIL
jgi:hypothetical protein